MGKGFQKSLQICLSKLRIPIQADPNQNSFPTTATNWLIAACKYPKTPSFAADRRLPPGHDGGGSGHAATLSDVDRFVFENFNSLYSSQEDDDDVDYGGAADSEDYLIDECSSPPPIDAEPPPGVRASMRFFVSPGTSNSLLDEAQPSGASSSSSSSSDSSSSTATVTKPPTGLPGAGVEPDDSVAVVTLSKDPYKDFLRSMKEMVESRHVDPRDPLDWEFMQELLFCYLELNDQSVHKHILGAFIDLAVTLRLQRRLRRRRPWRLPTGTGRRTPAVAAAFMEGVARGCLRRRSRRSSAGP